MSARAHAWWAIFFVGTAAAAATGNGLLGNWWWCAGAITMGLVCVGVVYLEYRMDAARRVRALEGHPYNGSGPRLRHTRALRISRWERLVRRLTGRLPQRAAERRLAAVEKDEAEARRG